jgi:transposase
MASATSSIITIEPDRLTVDHWCMRPYSRDLRQKVVQAVERGMSKSQAARLFSISLSSVKRYTRLASQGGSLTPRKGGGRPPIANQTTRKLLEEDIRTRPAATVKERRHHFLQTITGKSLSEVTLRGLLKRMGFSRKKERGGAGTRRVAKSSLESDGRPRARCSLSGFRR